MTFCAEQFDILFCCFRSFYSMKHGTLYIIRDTNIQRWRKGYLFHRNVRKPISQIGCCLAILLVTLPQINWIEITSLVLRFHYFSREKKSSMNPLVWWKVWNLLHIVIFESVVVAVIHHFDFQSKICLLMKNNQRSYLMRENLRINAFIRTN